MTGPLPRQKHESSYVDLQNAIDDITKRFLEDKKNTGFISMAPTKDPALSGKSDGEIKSELLTYPGVIAIAVHDYAHRLYNTPDDPADPGKRARARVEARRWSEAAHSRTGIDIHPGTTIGELCFIDHGTGTVVGETARIGKNDLIYHGVTLGAYGTTDIRHRHPEVGDNCVISTGVRVLGHVMIGDNVSVGPGATLLGNFTTIGSNVKIGAHAHIASGGKSGDDVEIASNVKIGARAVISKGVGRIDRDVPDDVRVSKNKDGSLHFSEAVPSHFTEKLRLASIPSSAHDWQI